MPFICGLEGVERLVVAELGEKRLLAAAVAGQMDVAVDQSRQDRLGAEVDEGDAGLDAGQAGRDGDDPAIVDDDRGRPERSLAGDGNQSAGVDVTSVQRERRRRPKRGRRR